MKVNQLKYESIVEKLRQQIAKYSTIDFLAIGVVFIISLLNFGRILSSYTFNNDGISRINEPFYNFFDYTEKGRWAYAFVYHLFNSDAFTPFLSVLITIILQLLVIILIWKEFNIKQFIPRVFSGGLFLSFPILIHYFFYTGDAEAYTAGMLLMLLGVGRFRQSKFRVNIGSIIFSTIALGIYPASFSFLTTLYIGYALINYHQFENLKQSFTLFWKGVVISVISLVLYFAITKLFIWYFGLELTDYKDAANISVMGLVARFPSKILMVFDLFGNLFLRFNSFTRLAFLILNILFAFYLIPKNGSWIVKIITPIIWLAILILSVFSTYFITYDSHLYVGYIFGILLYLAFLSNIIFEKIHGLAKTVVIIILGFFIFKNIQNNNVITHTHELNFDAAKLLANNILGDIQKTPNYKMSETPVIFIGYIGNNPKYNFRSPSKTVRVLNNMYVPVGFKENRAFKLKNLFFLMYNDVQVYYQDEDWESKQLKRFENTPVYPVKESVFVVSDTVFVKLGNLPPSN